MKKYPVLPYAAAALVTLSLISLAHAAGTSVSGDEVCGATADKACTFADIGGILKGVLKVIIALGLPMTVVFVSYRFVMAWFALQQGNANAYKEALQKSGNAMLGFLLIVAVFGGIVTLFLKYFGIKDEPLKLLEIISKPVSFGLVEHAYAIEYAHAAGGARSDGLLPNFFVSDDIYDLLLSAFRLVMRFFIYPALIVIWVWTGFSFVLAQGAPEALSKAKKWLMWAFITTLVIFVIQGFVTALRGTVEAILPGSTSQVDSGDSSSPAGTPDGRGEPAPGALNSACTTGSGISGQIGTDGTCKPGRGGGSSNTAEYCKNQKVGEVCTVMMSGGTTATGVCDTNNEDVKSCYKAVEGMKCLTAAGVWGSIDASGSRCVAGGAAPSSDVSCSRANGGACTVSGMSGTCADFDCKLSDVSCSRANGGVCATGGEKGTCSDWNCIVD